MARTIHDFKNSDILTYGMNGRLVVLNDGGSEERYNTTLVFENKVIYSNTREGMKRALTNPNSGLTRLLPKQCHAVARALAGRF